MSDNKLVKLCVHVSKESTLSEYVALVLNGEVLGVTSGSFPEESEKMLDSVHRGLAKSLGLSEETKLLEMPSGWSWPEALAKAGLQPAMEREFLFSAKCIEQASGTIHQRNFQFTAGHIEQALEKLGPDVGEHILQITGCSCDGETVEIDEEMLIKEGTTDYKLVPVANAGIWIQVGNIDLRIRATDEGASVTYYPAGDGLDSIGESFVFFNEACADEQPRALPRMK